MGGFLAKMISKKILGESLENKFGHEDPYFETIPASKLGDTSLRKKGKKRRKALPPGISDHDRKVLTKVKRRAYRLDMCLFSCCGISFGWSSVIGFMPGIGDAIDAFMALMVFRTCQQVEGGLPQSISLKMMANIIIDFCIGLVPVMGDICDAMFRANTRNAVVLENFLRDKGAKNLMGHSDNPPPDPSDPEEFDRREREELSASSLTAATRAKATTRRN
ncbi:BgTH12-07068 [Blumeria graminis f. sp. triticale]|uniref:Bgt-300 n=3 Tax=Blumeria graminis TaxID=34373 RepID=A0A061HEA4_BLUGR|nr:hypothetical protein BGT96224_300 [Blumeria graminis f. sp. tritici 96224]CAD6506138.1 BgTH12-07068 [Blumeria graminis f. sp. triticale]VDB94833.1 Bgt-300 [Blumeria graminis f. sp. tritici]